MSYPRPLCPEDFGAKGDGVTNDNAAFAAMFVQMAAALLVGHSQVAELGQKTYLVTGPLSVPPGGTVQGTGDSSILKTATNASVLKVTGESTLLRGFQILGNSVGANQIGIENGDPATPSSGFADVVVDDITFKFLPTGIRTAAIAVLSHHGPLITNCRAFSSGNGKAAFNFEEGGEYFRMSDCQTYLCTVGVRIGTANYVVDNCTITDSTTTGVYITGRPTGLRIHGVVSNSQINHNEAGAEAILVDGTTDATQTTGVLFEGCNILGGPIHLRNVWGVRFDDCMIDVTDYFFEGSIGTRFYDCMLPATDTNIIHNNYLGGASDTYWDPTCVDYTARPPAFLLNQDQWNPRPGETSVSITDATYVLTATDIRYNVLRVTSSVFLTADRIVQLPLAKGAQFTVANETFGGFDLYLQGATGGGVIVSYQATATIECDGANWHATSKASWTPATPSGLQAWYLAADGPINGAGTKAVNGDAIAQWLDRSGRGDANRNTAQATVGIRPTYVAVNATINSKPSVHWVAGKGGLHSGAFTGSPFAQPISIAMIGYYNGTNTTQIAIDDALGASRMIVATNAGGGNNLDINAGVDLNGTSHPGTPLVQLGIFTGATSKEFYDSSKLANVTGNAGANPFVSISIGSTFADGAPILGDIVEVMVWDHALSDEDRVSLYNYAKQKYAI